MGNWVWGMNGTVAINLDRIEKITIAPASTGDSFLAYVNINGIPLHALREGTREECKEFVRDLMVVLNKQRPPDGFR
ncbi:MAG: hypothetical protein ABSA82_03225 [Thermacetogeniaceae bacterium]